MNLLLAHIVAASVFQFALVAGLQISPLAHDWVLLGCGINIQTWLFTYAYLLTVLLPCSLLLSYWEHREGRTILLVLLGVSVGTVPVVLLYGADFLASLFQPTHYHSIPRLLSTAVLLDSLMWLIAGGLAFMAFRLTFRPHPDEAFKHRDVFLLTAFPVLFCVTYGAVTSNAWLGRMTGLVPENCLTRNALGTCVETCNAVTAEGQCAQQGLPE